MADGWEHEYNGASAPLILPSFLQQILLSWFGGRLWLSGPAQVGTVILGQAGDLGPWAVVAQ